MLESNIRQIAIQAIAARASGSPVEAAEQILAGIAALDSPGKPFVIWPTSLTAVEQIEALELELKRVRHAQQSMADYHAKCRSDLQRSLDSRGEHQGAQSHPGSSCAPAAELESQEAHGVAKAEDRSPSAPAPAQVASDASQ